MLEYSVENLTLREKLREADRVLRDFSDHLDRAFVPKAHDLHKLAKDGQDPENTMADVTFRNEADRLLRTERYTSELFVKVEHVFSSIQREVQEIVEG